MKNIHILPTNKPSRLVLDTINSTLFLTTTKDFGTKIMQFQNIYITNSEEIKEGDCFLEKAGRQFPIKWDGKEKLNFHCKKIILTTDQDLIDLGVQAIDDEFLEWFVKNPSCQYGGYKDIDWDKIIIPKEELTISDEAKQRAKNYMSLKGALEPKQETLEEAAENYVRNESDDTLKLVSKYSFKDGAKWQAERMYSEEEVHKILCKSHNAESTSIIANTLKKWLEQFKKK